ncbi:uncharacterized protein LOC125658094 isoform X2 [Ostrea edulis]|uniref:uncharacterized protein LOC125658094 isoform X2 n=1 Tax=Ostrea edulis TaxID=37623 RepID=UPI0020942CD1|nr:uncharacterized protein LOC125658094 isoform X2 [Ostrea edulis]XP_056005641.1 uncharacterized protein LOC125658094 isoform X2 [Ostrea edulis]XP_056005642.1 uncharacterized protein LOC125658094 isoform X2 [Ostrea edulis]
MTTICGNCGILKEGMKTCGRCRQVYYCSRECQKMDWKAVHKAQCHGTLDGVPDERCDHKCLPDSSELDVCKLHVCAYCGVKENLKKCGRCLGVVYCSKSCQSRDWSQHKIICKKNDNIVDVIRTDGFKKQLEKTKSDRLRSQTVRHQNTARVSGFGNAFQMFAPSPMMRRDFADLSLKKSTTKIHRKQAKLYAERKFPMQCIIEDIEKIPQEFSINFGVARISFVGFISRYHHYRARHCVYIQDRNEEEIYLGFYLDYDDPYPYFTWGDVRPGRFICLHDPCIHFFLDGSIGIRVDNSSEVFIFDV